MKASGNVIGCLFGSFNPIHTGHLFIGEYMAAQTDCSEVRFIVTPHNPLKTPAHLADEIHRLQMTRLGVRNNKLLSVDPVEYSLKRPSYTLDTLKHLRTRHPENTYRLIIGSDNLAEFRKWRNWKEILDKFGCYVYLRPKYSPGILVRHPNVRLFDAPFLDISGAYIRQCLKNGNSIRYLVPDNVLRYIEQHGVFDFLD